MTTETEKQTLQFETYPAYKDSGVEWLGDIPSHWEGIPIRAIFEERREKNIGPKTDFILSVTRDRGVIPYDEKGAIGNNKSEDIERYKIVQVNDLVINKMNIVIGSLGKSKYFGALSQVYIVFRPKSLKYNIDYYSLLVSNEPFYKSMIRYCTGIMELRESLNLDEFKKLLFPVPPLQEQIQIAGFLDRKTAQIDKAIGIKQRQIELLKERRQILIHKAVTHGLNPNVAMKDSGVEWIGEIPAHWEIQPIKYSLFGIVDCEHSTAPFVDEKEFFVVRTSNVKNGLLVMDEAKYTHEKGFKIWTARGVPIPGDVLLTREAPAGEACLVPADKKVCLGQRMVWLKINKAKLNSQFAIYLIYSKVVRTYIDYLSAGSTVLHFNMSDIKNIPIMSLSITEQEKIVNYTEGINRKIATAISLKEKEIATLKEYKASLINSAVTGKIKVDN